jgi:hypothetical protein
VKQKVQQQFLKFVCELLHSGNGFVAIVQGIERDRVCAPEFTGRFQTVALRPIHDQERGRSIR